MPPACCRRLRLPSPLPPGLTVPVFLQAVWAAFPVLELLFFLSGPLFPKEAHGFAFAWLDVAAKSVFRVVLRHLNTVALAAIALRTASAEAKAERAQ